MVTVMVFGSFDVLHEGHRSLFEQARSFGDRLVVIVARDATYELLRGYAPVHDEVLRLKSVGEESLVDEAFLGDLADVYAPIKRLRPDVVCLGYDQEAFVDGLEDALGRFGFAARLVRLRAHSPERFKSSILKKGGL